MSVTYQFDSNPPQTLQNSNVTFPGKTAENLTENKDNILSQIKTNLLELETNEKIIAKLISDFYALQDEFIFLCNEKPRIEKESCGIFYKI